MGEKILRDKSEEILQIEKPSSNYQREGKENFEKKEYKYSLQLSKEMNRREVINDLIQRTSACNLIENNPNKISPENVDNFVSKGSCENALKIDYDTTSLKVMHNRLTECVRESEYSEWKNNSQHKLSANHLGANKWITKYVDYTSKYGLGFLFNDGSSGVYFNDSTKVVLTSEGKSFIYIDRKKTLENEAGTCEPLYNEYTLNSFPQKLQKKVTLLNHFRSYLIQENEKCGEKHIENFNISQSELDVRDTVFLKKWVRTKHAILFRFSNRTVQVVFYDRTEILLCSDGRVVTYVGKNMARTSYYLGDIIRSGSKEG